MAEQGRPAPEHACLVAIQDAVVGEGLRGAEAGSANADVRLPDMVDALAQVLLAVPGLVQLITTGLAQLVVCLE